MIPESCTGTDKRDVGMREDTFDTLTELGDDLCHPLTGFLEGSGMDIGLRRDTAHIQTRAAHVARLKDNHLQTLLSGIFSGAVATRPRTDDNQIRLIH